MPIEKKTVAKKLRGSNFNAVGFGNNRWQAYLDENQSFDDALDPGFWGHCVDRIIGHDKKNPQGLGDIIEIRSHDKTKLLEVLIVGIGPGYLKVIPGRIWGEEDPVLPVDSPLKWKWNIGTKKYDVVHRSDNRLMSSGHQTKAAAAKWIAEQVKAMAA